MPWEQNDDSGIKTRSRVSSSWRVFYQRFHCIKKELDFHIDSPNTNIIVPIVGFETDNSTTSLELMEGHKMEVCVGLLDPKKPEDMKMRINIGVALTPDSPQGKGSSLQKNTED